MKVKVITNNPKVNEYSVEKGYDTAYLNGSSQAVLLFARDLVLCGWRLAADPLAGYISRYNPYHTVFLQENFDDEPAMEDILRLEKGACHFENPERPKDMSQKIKSDYLDMDSSIAISTMQGLIRNLRYVESIY